MEPYRSIKKMRRLLVVTAALALLWKEKEQADGYEYLEVLIAYKLIFMLWHSFFGLHS